MRPTLIAFALLTACAGHGARSPEGEVYWACVEYYEAAIECGLEPEGSESCDAWDLTPCAEKDAMEQDAEACDAAVEQVRQLNAAIEDMGQTLEDMFPLADC